jgi:hypothetical protein
VNTGAGWSEIVGIVRDIKQTSLIEPLEPQFYRPYAEDPVLNMTLAMRSTSVDPTSLVPAIRRVVRDLDATVIRSSSRNARESSACASHSERTRLGSSARSCDRASGWRSRAVRLGWLAR